MYSTTVGAVAVQVTSNTGSIVTKVNAFEYLEPGVVDLVSPARGQLGTLASIYGSNLLGGGTSIVSITLAGVHAEVLSFTNETIAIRVSQSLSLGLGDIVITSNTFAKVNQTNGWTYDVPSNITDVCV